MQILLLAWEYPPALVGGLGRHVHELSKAVAAQGHTVHVITAGEDGAQGYECKEGVHVHRVCSRHGGREPFSAWIEGLNDAMMECADRLCAGICFDTVHAHDWLVWKAALYLQEKWHLPLTATIHATEHGRNNGIHTALQQEIHEKEQKLVKAADSLIVCSYFMKREIEQILHADPSKISVFPNGIHPEFFTLQTARNVREQYGLQQRLLIFSIGRIVNEKGFYTIIEAAPLLAQRHPAAVFVIAGKGPLLERYRMIVRERQLGHVVWFVGYISEAEQRAFLQQSDIVLVPSLYEPFGIVALEGMLAKKPTVVADTGGLGEIVTHARTGFKTVPGNAWSLGQQLSEIIEQPRLAAQAAEQGYEHVKHHYNWDSIARQTILVYRKVSHSYQSGG
ncbi:glycosyltransferase family 4 protein [Ectobacillus ponti]|uniref:Glycosyltransferase family 4 protein n=1 Tax=Ectobacillus ponti TaxID=2961894 RepID=A0AA41X6D2_9BACI|nr:glycosyltransferase family 4 protein [Ectobacillus ponti]MCP8967133.1 glycosyltransferase family 4 protein [Ectobacillus ponti]